MKFDQVGVHVTHCCLDHGCKYGDEDCPVANGEIKQQYACEDCEDGIPVPISIDDFEKQMKEKLERFIAYRKATGNIKDRSMNIWFVGLEHFDRQHSSYYNDPHTDE